MLKFPPTAFLCSLLCVGVLLAFGCEKPNSSRAAPMDEQFRMRGVRLNETFVQGGKLQGQAEEALGDLENTKLKKVRLYFTPKTEADAENGSEDTFILTAPEAQINRPEKSASLNTIHVEDPRGGELEAPTGVLALDTGFLQLSGPLTYRADDFSAWASEASVEPNQDVIHIRGPVVGRYWPGKSTTDTSSTLSPLDSKASRSRGNSDASKRR